MKVQLILGVIVIISAIASGIMAHFAQEVSLVVLFVWLGIIIVSWLHIICDSRGF